MKDNFKFQPALRLAIFAFASISICANAHAQDSDDLSISEALRLCAGFEDKTERLACFEALAAAAPAEPADDSAKEKPAEETDTAQSARADELDASLAQATTDNTAPKAKPDPAPALKKEETFTFVRKKPSEDEKSDYFAPYENRERHSLTVYKSWRDPRGELRIAFTNGQIWRQTSRGTRYDPERGEAATLKPRPLGGWSISVNQGRDTFFMRRIR